MNKSELFAALELAISAYKEDTPGTWSVNGGDDYLQLVWQCDAEEIGEELSSDEPWEQWGGDAIIEAANAPEPNDSGCDGYTDKYGDDITAQWVQWNFK